MFLCKWAPPRIIFLSAYMANMRFEIFCAPRLFIPNPTLVTWAFYVVILANVIGITFPLSLPNSNYFAPVCVTHNHSEVQPTELNGSHASSISATCTIFKNTFDRSWSKLLPFSTAWNELQQLYRILLVSARTQLGRLGFGAFYWILHNPSLRSTHPSTSR